ncbi:MAG: hypothetical protein QW507_00470 [Candidatus Nanoarchaeia archaeon]|nr:hypothetical protein [Candidatus Haiyanarchaeum thermophilum]MCW1302945.1 hypothetical protein [Candidatus Haiyanarchaeum thermophilum]MCW1303623.1 hypothetical protein [Candidatus Haiyanarchaeum thermophilum]MCW1306304.1 hypothetical protein [Candidatus Haiyanarchaeum thermophilum]MCW1307186.1 hypothetical protein [Candidatus Haiyanarchaeum thermophilum]
MKDWQELEHKISALNELTDKIKGIEKEKLLGENLGLVVAGKKLIQEISEKFGELLNATAFLKTSGLCAEELNRIEYTINQKLQEFTRIKRKFEESIVEISV